MEQTEILPPLDKLAPLMSPRDPDDAGLSQPEIPRRTTLMLTLIVLDASPAANSQTLEYVVRTPSVIGRDTSCEVCVPDLAVSRRHARVDFDSDGAFIEDLDSTSGTFLNERLLKSPTELLEGDVIRIGAYRLRVHVQPERALETPRYHDGGDRPLTQRLAIDTRNFKISTSDLSLELSSEAGRGDLAARLETLLSLARGSASYRDRASLFREAGRQLLGYFKEADRVLILEHDEAEGDTPRLRFALYGPHARRDDDSARLDRRVLEAAISDREGVLHTSRSEDQSEARSTVCAPLWQRDEVLGAIYLDARSGRFDESSLRFLTATASIIATALENVRLFESVRDESARRANLERYFAKDLVERILNDELPYAREGQTRNATITMVDICGFSDLTNQVAAPLLIGSLNGYFATIQRIIFSNHGTVERFGGDSVLAYWGVLEKDRYASWHGCLAAIAMQNAMPRLNRDLEKAGTPPLSIAIGVNTGEIIAGDVGSEERYEFTVLGDAVNMARRLQDLAPSGEIYVGEETVLSVGRSALTRPLPPRTVKGRRSPLPMSLLFGCRTASDIGARYLLSIGGELRCQTRTQPARAVGVQLDRSGSATLELSAATEPDAGPAVIALELPMGRFEVAGVIVENEDAPETTAYWTDVREDLEVELEGPYEVELICDDPEALRRWLGVAAR